MAGEAVASVAPISSSQALAKYFPNKAALYDALFLLGHRLFREAEEEVWRTTTPDWERIRRWFEVCLALACEHPDLFHLIWGGGVPGFTPSEASREEIARMIAGARRGVGEVVEAKGVDAGLPLERVVDILLAVRHGIVAEHLAKRDVLPPGSDRFCGLVLAELPALFRQANAAVTDLEWVLANKELFPAGIRRSIYRALARAYATQGRTRASHEALQRSGYSSLDPDLPQLITEARLTADDGFRFVSPRLVEPVPGVFIAQGYDFADFAFVVTADGVVAIDSSTTPVHARAALDELRRYTDLPITHVIVTHAHWDHVGGLSALTPPGAEVIARSNFADELRIVNETGVPMEAFFGRDGSQEVTLQPDRLVAEPETLVIGGLEFALYPAHGGETDDALLIHLTASGVLFVGDVLMPQVGAPFLPEGSVEGLLDTLSLIEQLQPRHLIHGHTPLTENIGPDVLPGLEVALRDLYRQVLQAVRSGQTLVEILGRNILPASLRSHSNSVVPFVLMRDNLIQRLYHQRTGYWKPDREGVEQVAPAEWAATLDLMAGGKERAFARSARALLDQGNAALALKVIELGELRHPSSRSLPRLRRQALDRLRERYQQLQPFKFILYSALAGGEISPVPE